MKSHVSVLFTLLVLLLGSACGGDGSEPAPDTPAPVESLLDLYLYEETDTDPDDDLLAEFDQSNDVPYVLVGRVVLPDGRVPEGGLLVEDGRIIEVWEGGVPETVQADVTIQTGGIILPGLIDLHNHVAYNFLPFWDSGRTWDDRYQWAGAQAYQTAVKDPYNKAKGDVRLIEEMNKYGEIRALVGGATSIIGTFPSRGSGILVRNIDQRTLGGDRMRTWVGPASDFGCNRTAGCPDQPAEIAELKETFDNRRITAILFHVAEGIDADSRAEFQWFEDNGLLRPEVVFIHGTALEAAELDKMGGAGMGLVWSPRSNVELYGKTTDIAAAKAAGVQLALAPDWSPSGSDNMLAELRYAAELNEEQLDCLFTARELVEMVTITPARIAQRDDMLGKLEAGYAADLLVLRDRDEDPYDTVLYSDEGDVRLVAVNGVPVYGWRSWLRRLGKQIDGVDDFSELRVRGALRGLDTDVEDADSRVPSGTQSFEEIRDALTEAYAEFGELPGLTANSPAAPAPRAYCAAS